MAQQPPPIPGSRAAQTDSPPGPRPRPFPWKLWLFAVLMTGAAGAGGYFSWFFHTQADGARTELDHCTRDLAALQTTATGDAERLRLCTEQLGATATRTSDLEKQNSEATRNLSATQEELTALRAQKAEADRRMAAIEDIRKRFATMIDTGQLRVTARRGQLVLSLPSEVLFPTGSAELSKQGEASLLEVAGVLKQFPDRRFMVVGHTDNQVFAKPKGEPAEPACGPTDNWQLSTARALTVTRVLVTAGMNARSLVSAGVGEHDPVASNKSAAGRRKNRRIEIVLLPAIGELPPMPSGLGDETTPED